MSGAVTTTQLRNMRVFALSIGCFACMTATGAVEAQAKTGQTPSDSAYEQLIDRALDAFEKREFSRARALFEQAHARQPSARTLRGLGVTAVELRNYESAEDELEAALADHRRPLTSEQRLEVTELLEWMRSSLGILHLELTPPSAIARIDERRTAGRTLRLDPGEHALEVRAEGYRLHVQRFSVERGEELALRIDLQRELFASAESPQPQPIPATAPARMGGVRDGSTAVWERWWFWTAVGVVVAGGAVAAWALTADPGVKPLEAGGAAGVFETLRVQQ